MSQTGKPQVAVVVLNFNGSEFLSRFLPTLEAQTADVELIVADNGSTDNSVTLLEDTFPNVRLIRFEENHGFAGGYNMALSQVESDYYVIINSDIEVTPGWLSPMIMFLEQNQEYASCQPKIRSYEHRNEFEYAGAAGGFLDSLGYPYCRGRLFDTLEKDEGQYDQPVEVMWTTGACMVIRSSDFHAVGGFDAAFFAHMEEIDLCWRLHALGRKMICVPQSTVYHVGGGTLSRIKPFKTYLNFRNGLVMLFKNLPASQRWKIPVRMILDLAAGLRFWKDHGFWHFWAVVRAHWAFATGIRQTLKRRNLQPQSAIGNHLIHSKSILIDYFLKNKRTFSSLLQHTRNRSSRV